MAWYPLSLKLVGNLFSLQNLINLSVKVASVRNWESNYNCNMGKDLSKYNYNYVYQKQFFYELKEIFFTPVVGVSWKELWKNLKKFL